MSDDDGVVEARILCDYRIPVSPHNDVMITGPFPLSEPEWHRLIRVIDVMRPGLVIIDAEETSWPSRPA